MIFFFFIHFPHALQMITYVLYIQFFNKSETYDSLVEFAVYSHFWWGGGKMSSSRKGGGKKKSHV